MSDSTKNIELIERYFDDEMTEAEKNDFQQQLKSDRELKHMYDREHLLINTVRFGAAKSHLDFLKELEKSLPEITVETKRSNWPYYAVAASVVLLVVTGIYLFTDNEPNPSALYAEYYTPFPNVWEPTVRGSETVTQRSLAFQKYEEGDYLQAVDLFKALLAEKREPEILLLLGNANLSLGNTTEARENFNEVLRSSSTIAAPAQWYLALSYLKDNQRTEAIANLKMLADGKNAYTVKAKDLLKRLEP
ncbi:MAG TPA: tetratricopeptide repeat protein [Chryseosolibacter sp.]